MPDESNENLPTAVTKAYDVLCCSGSWFDRPALSQTKDHHERMETGFLPFDELRANGL